MSVEPELVDGPLTGFDVLIDNQRYLLGAELHQHRDRSRTYVCRHMDLDLVVRVFNAQPASDNYLLKVPATASHLWTYKTAGPADLSPPTKYTKRLINYAYVTVREYAPKTLKDVLAVSLQTVSLKKAALEIASGLKELHGRNLIHGDLRPSNILVMPDTATFLLMDYGVSDYAKPGSAGHGREQRYLAPELLLKRGPVTAPGDVYSYGKLLRDLIHGSAGVKNDELSLLLELVDRCLELEPRDRPSIEQVISLLQERTWIEPTEAELSAMRPAVAADIDARLPNGLSADSEWFVPRAINNGIRQTIADLRRTSSPRASGLTDLDWVHFFATAAFLDNYGRRLASNARRSHGLIKAMEYFSRTSDVEGSDGGPDNLATQIDAQWAIEIERNARADLDGRDLTEDEISRRVDRQLEAAIQLAHGILRSDAFLESSEVAVVMGARCPGITSEEVRILSEFGYVLSLPVAGRNLYPMFQFNSEGLPYSTIQAVQQSVNTERSRWSSSLWWFINHPSLDGQTPAQWIRAMNDPAAVLNLFDHVAA